MSSRIVFEQELSLLKHSVREMSERAEISYDKLLIAAAENQREVLQELLAADREFLEMQRRIEAMCLTLLTKQQPLATDLRVVSAALKVVTDVERIGDHVTDMAELFLRLEPPFHPQRRKLLQAMMVNAKEMVHDAVEAFVSGNRELAEKVIAQDDVVDDYFNQVKECMMEGIRNQTLGADEIVDVLLLAKYVEKIADHAVNISDWAIFQQTGNMQNKRLL